MTVTTFEYAPQALRELLTRVRAAISSGAKEVVLDLDRLPALESDETRGLVLLLRRSREIGGDVVLRVTREDIRRSLEAMALDRVFSMEPAA